MNTRKVRNQNNKSFSFQALNTLYSITIKHNKLYAYNMINIFAKHIPKLHLLQ